MAFASSRSVQAAPGSNSSWKRVDPDTRRQSWTQTTGVTSRADGTFSCDIVLKETDPSYLKPLVGGYSLTRANVLKLQWQSNGQDPGVFYRYFTNEDSRHNGSYYVDERAVRQNWRVSFKGFPNRFIDAGAQIGVYRIWGKGAPANTFLGDMTATLTVTDKYNCH